MGESLLSRLCGRFVHASHSRKLSSRAVRWASQGDEGLGERQAGLLRRHVLWHRVQWLARHRQIWRRFVRGSRGFQPGWGSVSIIDLQEFLRRADDRWFAIHFPANKFDSGHCLTPTPQADIYNPSMSRSRCFTSLPKIGDKQPSRRTRLLS